MTDTITKDSIDEYNDEIQRLISEIEGNCNKAESTSDDVLREIEEEFNDFDEFIVADEERYLSDKYETRHNDSEFGTYGSIRIPDNLGGDWDDNGLDIFEVAEFFKGAGYMYSIDYFGDYYILTYSAMPKLYELINKNEKGLGMDYGCSCKD